MNSRLNKEYSARQMAQLYREMPGVWLLLEVLEQNELGTPQRLKLLAYSPDKEDLYDYLMDQDDNWNWNKKYIFVYSDPEKECPLN